MYIVLILYVQTIIPVEVTLYGIFHVTGLKPTSNFSKEGLCVPCSWFASCIANKNYLTGLAAFVPLWKSSTVQAPLI